MRRGRSAWVRTRGEKAGEEGEGGNERKHDVEVQSGCRDTHCSGCSIRNV